MARRPVLLLATALLFVCSLSLSSLWLATQPPEAELVAKSLAPAPRPRIGILTSLTCDKASIYRFGTASKQCYAKRKGHSVILDVEDNGAFNPWWRKVFALEKHLGDFDWLMWMDGDTMFMNYAPELEWFLPDDPDVHYVMTDHNCAINDGVFFIRNSEWSRKFIARWKAEGEKMERLGKRWAWDDQGALFNLLLYYGHEQQGKVYDDECGQEEVATSLDVNDCFLKRMDQLGYGYRQRNFGPFKFVDSEAFQVPQRFGNITVRGAFDQYNKFELALWVRKNWREENFFQHGDFVLHAYHKGGMARSFSTTRPDECEAAETWPGPCQNGEKRTIREDYAVPPATQASA